MSEQVTVKVYVSGRTETERRQSARAGGKPSKGTRKDKRVKKNKK